ncbi:M14 family zinc carboxypeptidase, partial [Bacillus massiliigorillae]|uniref:M14 family zinc carboxypeptidase n=1 Tax=Bacillus massiliigorillae TaxID=1243664 RepID=UPI0009DD9495
MRVFIPFCLLFLFLNAFPTRIDASYYSYEQMEEEVLNLQNNYGNKIQIGYFGKSEWGKKLPYIKVGKGSQSVFLIGAHHGREWITSQFLMKLLKEYVSAYDEDTTINGYSTRIFDEISFIFIPMLNPDGVDIQQKGLQGLSLSQGLKLLSMNEFHLAFDRWKANGEGVDLNRQYPSGWKELNQIPAWPSYKHFRGTKPVQAAEVKALVDFTVQQKPLLSLSYHTSGQQVFWYYHTKKEYIERDYLLAEKIARLTGYELDLPNADAVGGGYTDWFITTFRKPAFTIEMCELVKETNPPASCLRKEWAGNREVPMMLLYELKKESIKRP